MAKHPPKKAKTAPKHPVAVRARRVREPAVAYADELAVAAVRPGGGVVRRKNLNVDQALLDRARAVLGVDTETEAVALALTAVVEEAQTREQLASAFDSLMRLGVTAEQDPDEVLDLSGFGGAARSAAR